MAYVEGFIVAVPAANKEAYRKHAADAAPLFKEYGVRRMVETWGDDVPDGKVTDFRRAVKAEEGEVVVFSWFEYPDKATRESATKKMMADPRMEAMGQAMPFDASRMVYGGFEVLGDDGDGARMGYVDGTVLAAPVSGKDEYITFMKAMSAVFKEHGASRIVDAWADDLPDGKVTDFKGAVKAEGHEAVVFSWVEWPSKEARDAGWKNVMADPRMGPDQPMPFDGKRMIFGGFAPIVDI